MAALTCRDSPEKPWDVGPQRSESQPSAQAYCRSLGKRLPTFDEWLYAARGSHSQTLYPWGDSPPITSEKIRANSGRYSPGGGRSDRADRHKYAGPVELFSKVPSPFGAANLVGNVREWTSTEADRKVRVVGGGWQSAPHQLRLTRLDLVRATKIANDIGFRCASSPDKAQ